MRKVEEIPKVYEELANYRFPETELSKEDAAEMYRSGRAIRVEKADKPDDSRYFLRLAVEHAPKEQTRKGYDTTGITKQFLVNALNEVLGVDGWETQANYSQPSPGWGTQPESSRVCVLRLRLKFFKAADDEVWVDREACGGHSDYHGDVGNSLKGAHTAAFKRACAEFGLGREAFEGLLDPDFMAIGKPREREAKPKERVQPAEAESAPAKDTNTVAGGRVPVKSVREGFAWLEKNVPAVKKVAEWRDAFADYCFVVGGVDIMEVEDGDELRKVLGDAMRAVKVMKDKPKAVADLLNSARVQRHGGA